MCRFKQPKSPKYVRRYQFSAEFRDEMTKLCQQVSSLLNLGKKVGEVKGFPCLIKHYAMKTYGGVEV
jgi:hypothetical protein